MAEEEKEEKKKSWWKWAAGAIAADQYINSKIEGKVSKEELEEEVDKRVREKMESLVEEARYQAEEKEQEVKDRKHEQELKTEVKKVMEKINKFTKSKKNNLDISSFNHFFELSLKFINALIKLVTFYEEKSVDRTDFLKKISEWINHVYSIFFECIIDSLNHTLNSAKNRAKLQKKELETFNKMFKKWIEVANSKNVTKKDYDKFVEEVKKIKNASEMLQKIEVQVDLSRKIKELDKISRILTGKNKLQTEENIAVTMEYKDNNLILHFRSINVRMQVMDSLIMNGVDAIPKDGTLVVDRNYEKKAIDVFKKFNFKFILLPHKKEEIVKDEKESKKKSWWKWDDKPLKIQTKTSSEQSHSWIDKLNIKTEKIRSDYRKNYGKKKKWYQMTLGEILGIKPIGIKSKRR